MKFYLYSIFDRKMNIFLSPFPSRGDVDAVRNVVGGFGQMKDTPVGQNPQDFDLVCIGQFDDDTGDILRMVPKTINSVADLVAKATSSTVPS